VSDGVVRSSTQIYMPLQLGRCCWRFGATFCARRAAALKVLQVLWAADLAVELVQLLLVVLDQVGQPRRLKVGLKVRPIALLRQGNK
jgi:hypothetical protein